MKEKAAYLKGLIEGLGIDETTKEGKVIKAMSELLGELAEAVDGIDEDVTRAYDQINDLSEELEDLEADLYEDDDEDDEDDEPEEDDADEDDNADVARRALLRGGLPGLRQDRLRQRGRSGRGRGHLPQLQGGL